MKIPTLVLALFLVATTLAQASLFRMSEIADSASDETSPLPYSNKEKIETLNVRNQAIITEKDIEKTAPYYDQSGYGVRITLSAEGAERLDSGIKNLFGKRLAVLIDNKVVSAPLLQTTSIGRILQISGNFTEQEARELAKSLAPEAK